MPASAAAISAARSAVASRPRLSDPLPFAFDPDDGFYSPAAFAELMDLDRESVYKLLAKKKIPSIKVGNSRRIPRSWVLSLSGGDAA